MIVPIGSDHAGFNLKKLLVSWLSQKGYAVEDYGCHSEESVDYPDFGHAVADHIEKHGGLGIVICGSGNGINMTVNKHPAIRSALCWCTETAVLAREHNDANIIALPARFVSVELAVEMVQAFFSTEFEGGRHERRVKKIACQ